MLPDLDLDTGDYAAQRESELGAWEGQVPQFAARFKAPQSLLVEDIEPTTILRRLAGHGELQLSIELSEQARRR